MRRNLVSFAAVLVFSAKAFGQTAAITGVITDAGGGAVGDAAVTARNVGTGIKSEAQTKYEGYYTFPRLDPGNYELTVRKSGFRMATHAALNWMSGRWRAWTSVSPSAMSPRA
jgi:Carboxypeptidase regulatory-like domain